MTRTAAAKIIDLDARRTSRAPRPPRRAVAWTPKQPIAGDIATELTTFLNARRARGRSLRTLASYRESVNLLITFLDATGRSRNVADITNSDIDAFLNAERDGDNRTPPRAQSPASVAIRYRGIRAFFRFLTGLDDRGHPTGDPVIDRSPVTGGEPTVPQADVPVITDDQIKILTSYLAKDKSFDGRRDLAIVSLF
ncbi:MAG TPA: site-specific integrase, partial [Candidatus Limnocylindria bacterium]|nr:site-specific integrase [Candidatus Limnocylindria bacterium]